MCQRESSRPDSECTETAVIWCPPAAEMDTVSLAGFGYTVIISGRCIAVIPLTDVVAKVDLAL
jgi:hypothetical protein